MTAVHLHSIAPNNMAAPDRRSHIFGHVLRLCSRPEEGGIPVKFQTEKGAICIGNEVFTTIAGMAATNCFGVKGMAVRSKRDGLIHLLRRESMARGVKVTSHEDGSVSIELHIMVDNGVNFQAVGDSIMNEVRYVVTRYTGVEVKDIHVCIDSMVIG